MKIIHYSEAEAKKYPSEQAKNANGRWSSPGGWGEEILHAGF